MFVTDKASAKFYGGKGKLISLLATEKVTYLTILNEIILILTV